MLNYLNYQTLIYLIFDNIVAIGMGHKARRLLQIKETMCIGQEYVSSKIDGAFFQI